MQQERIRELPRMGGPVQGWFDVRGRGIGMWAYVLNRITGLGLVLYLVIHLAVLSLLARGEAAWDSFISMAKSPFFLFLDVVLLAGLLIHGLNGLRITLLAFGIGVQQHKVMFYGLMLVAAVLLVTASVRIFGM
jgi:succinate dehydrogenase / fumarate reductase cytochrome b subunit